MWQLKLFYIFDHVLNFRAKRITDFICFENEIDKMNSSFHSHFCLFRHRLILNKQENLLCLKVCCE